MIYAAGIDVGRIRHRLRQRAGDRAHPFERKRGRDRVAAGGPQRLDRVGQRIERRRPGHTGR